MCSPKIEREFEELFTHFRGSGFYVPQTEKKNIDKRIIRQNLKFIKEKITWIESNLKKLKKEKKFKKQKKKLRKLRSHLRLLLASKKKYFLSNNKDMKFLARNKSRKQLKEFKKLYKDFLSSIYFLKTYRFPVNFFKLRKQYDFEKSSKGSKHKKNANQIYFFRKLVEDGAQNPDHKRSDRFLRTSLSSIYLELMRHHSIISEDLRYDLNSSFKKILKYLASGVKHQIARQKEWLERSKKMELFYTDLLKMDHKTEVSLLNKRSQTRFALKKYVRKKQEKVHSFWQKQSEVNRALFSLSTILFNEVGDIEGKSTLERRDVSQVVLNRKKKRWYGYLGSKDYLFGVNNNKKMRKKIAPYRWINVLFKSGEFSFTYYFIHSNLRIFCPDMSSKGVRLRKQNLSIAYNALKKPNNNFKAERYFSRASMVGSVDMTKIWSDFSPYPERAGEKIKKSSYLLKRLRDEEYDYFYYFIDPFGRYFRVISIDEKTYVLSLEGEEFYTYRNRHYFKYFTPKK